ncbi:MAG: shikimate dehydrogenase, partial [Actinomycetota bacterium]|nr:shikimate dehydrogenase [Actinomycetota bacterium]
MLGSPVAHSLSPVLHTAAYRALGLDWTYTAHQIDEAGLAAFLDGLDASWRGLSLTMPLKRAVIPLLDGMSDVAAAAQAVNTVLLERDGRRVGDNTDVGGMVSAVRERTSAQIGSAAVLGAGATARSAVVALAQLGCRAVRL